MTCNLKVYSAALLKLYLRIWKDKDRVRQKEDIGIIQVRDVGNVSRVESSGSSVSSLMSMYILNVELQYFLSDLTWSVREREQIKINVTISAKIGKLQKESLGEKQSLFLEMFCLRCTSGDV